MTDSGSTGSEIAIVGMAARLPGARTPDEFWANLSAGRESIEPLTDDDLRASGVPESVIHDPNYVKVHAPIPDLKAFDAGFFGFSPREAEILDPQHRHFLEIAWEAFENAGHDPSRFTGAIGVFAGAGHHHYFSQHLLTKPELLRNVGFFLLRHTGNDKDFLATRVSYLLNLRGPSISVQTACSTSLVAVHLAAQSLLNGECDMALAGGVTIELPERRGYQFAEGEILSPDGRCRPFDADAQGTVFGSGAGAVVLRRLSDAIDDGDTVHAIIRGTAINNDGARKVGYLAPSVDGHAQVVAEALEIASVTPESVSFIETHGTGTPVGDPIEIAALAQVYGGSTHPIALGSVKSNIGHLDTAAGIASLIKVVESLKHREIAPTLHFGTPNPACAFDDTPFQVLSAARPWKATGPRRAGISSLGVGGTNAHVVVEEAAPSPATAPGDGPHLLTLSAKTPAALEQAAVRLAEHLQHRPTTPLHDAAWTLQVGRESRRHRVAVDARDVESAIEHLRDPVRLKQGTRRAPASPPPVTFLFAGGGAQFPGMGRDLYASEPVYREVVDGGLTLLGTRHGLELRSLLFAAEDDVAAAAELERPTRSLPLLFIVQAATAALWRSWGIEPTTLIGHSMGEYTAAYLAGVFSFDDGLALVQKRGELFERVPPGGMLSVALSADAVRPKLDGRLAIAAENAPELCVVAGPDDALATFERTLIQDDVDYQRIRIRIAAHSPMLDPILSDWRRFLGTITLATPTLPVVSNLSGARLRDTEATDPEYWVRQLRQTVRFAEGVETLLGDQPAVFVECGPGHTLTALTRQHAARQSRHELVTSLRRPGESGSDRAVTIASLGRLWSVGLTPDWTRVHQGAPRRRIPLPTYAFARDEHWVPQTEGPMATADGDSLSKSLDMSAWCFEPGWQRVAAGASTPLPAQVLVLGGPTVLRAELIAALSADGSEVTLVDEGDLFGERAPGHYLLDPERPEHFRDLFHALSKAQRLPGLVIHAWNVGTVRSLPHADRAPLASVAPLGSVLWVAQAIALANGPESVRLMVLTSGAQSVGGEPITAPLRAMTAAACRVMSTEGVGLTAHAVDLEWPVPQGPRGKRILESLAEAVRTDAGPQCSVALRGGHRWEPTFVPSPLPAPTDRPVMLRDGGTYLVTGGLGGIGLEVADLLSRHANARVALVSRTALPPVTAWEDLLSAHQADPHLRQQITLIRRMRARGAEVLLLTADISDRKAARRVVRTVTTAYGALHGIFHAAGLLDDALLGEKTPASVERVLRPKLQGSLALDEATAGMTLDCFVLFSSTSAFQGLPGQTDYAAASAFLDAFAHWRNEHRPGHTVSINWSVWQEVGMAARLADEQGVTVAPATGRSLTLRHHVLDRLMVDKPDELEVAGTIHPDRTWVIGEHRFRDGNCVLPGAAYLDLVVTVARLRDQRAVVLRDVTFTAACSVPDGTEREIRVSLRGPDSDKRSFSVRSRPAGRSADWTEHCHGSVAWFEPSATDPTTLDALRARVDSGAPVPRGARLSAHVDFGSRWHNVRRRSLRDREALLELDLGSAHEADLLQTPLHPALLDMGTAGAQMLLDGFVEEEHFFVPISYGRLSLHAPLEREILSHVRLRPGATADSDVAIYDVRLFAPDGRLLVDIEEFTMFRLRDTARFRAVVADDPEPARISPLAEALRVGILPSEGREVLLRVLAHPTVSQFAIAPAGTQQLERRPDEGNAGAQKVTARSEESTLELVSPRTALQVEMVRLITELLGTDRIGINEPLVDLGLHSLLAVRLFNRLQRLTGLNVPLSALLEAPTIELLSPRFGDRPDADDITPTTDAGTPAGPVEQVRGVYDDIEIPDSQAYILPPEEDPDTFSSLVSLKPSGSHTPFFVMHARGGAVLNYQRLTTFVEPQQPIYGLQSQGLDGVTEPLRSIEAMAAHYVRVIRTVQPHGPYLLGGGSLGGIVALEMAHQLKAVGEETGLLAMFDSWGPQVFMDSVRPTLTQHVRNKARRVVRLVEARGAFRTLRAVRRRITDLIGETSQTAIVRWNRLLQRGFGRQLPHAVRYQFVERVNLAALRVYRPEQWDGEVVIFRALDDPGFRASDPTMGWSETVRGPIRVVDCPGTHNTIMKGPVFGQYLTSELRRAHQAIRTGNANRTGDMDSGRAADAAAGIAVRA